MAMKQTQTKLFDFSDVDLDFCSGSKNKFPIVFKKMLAQGYNSKVVSNVTVAGDQVTLDYGANHGYSADRVLAINTPNLVGEFYIDSITANTLTITVPNAPQSITGSFTTKVASLGWELVYELAHVHIYKFKHIDETDMYVRLCFQNATTAGNRNCIAVGIGRTVNLSSGVITDENCPEDLRACVTVANATSNVRWDFSASGARTSDDYTYSQGLTAFGRGVIVGSKYHIFIAASPSNSTAFSFNYGIFPLKNNYPQLNYPMLLAANNGSSTSSIGANSSASNRVFVGQTQCLCGSTNTTSAFRSNIGITSYYPPNIDGFNTTGCFPIFVSTLAEGQPVGWIEGGLYQVAYSNNGHPSTLVSSSPSITLDVEYNNNILLHHIGAGVIWLCSPIEEIKNDT